MIGRYLVTFVLGGVVTFGLFYLMRTLIHMDEAGVDDAKKGRVIEFVRLKRDESVQANDRKLPEKAETEEPPPPPDLDFSESSDPNENAEGIMESFQIDSSLEGGPATLGAVSDGEKTPLVRVQPQYPLRAEERGIEGYVIVEFTITTAGTVKNPKIIEYEPSTIFNQAALRAVRRWKYNPTIEDGKPIETRERTRLVFELEN